MIESSSFAAEQELPAAVLFTADANAGLFDPDVEKCRDVWLRVLVESVIDYTFKRCTSQDFKEARDWLFHGQPLALNSFECVCGYVGISAEKLRPMIASLRTACLTRPERTGELMALLHGCGLARKPKP